MGVLNSEENTYKHNVSELVTGWKERPSTAINVFFLDYLYIFLYELKNGLFVTDETEKMSSMTEIYPPLYQLLF